MSTRSNMHSSCECQIKKLPPFIAFAALRGNKIVNRIKGFADSVEEYKVDDHLTNYHNKRDPIPKINSCFTTCRDIKTS